MQELRKNAKYFTVECINIERLMNWNNLYPLTFKCHVPLFIERKFMFQLFPTTPTTTLHDPIEIEKKRKKKQLVKMSKYTLDHFL